MNPGKSSTIFSICAIILSMSCIVYFLSKKKIQKRQSKVFLLILISIAISSLMAAISNPIEIEDGTVSVMASIIVRVTNQIYFLVHSGIAAMYALYIYYVSAIDTSKIRHFNIKFFMPAFIGELLVIINPLTHWVFYFKDDHIFKRGPMEMYIYITSGWYIILAIYTLLHFRNIMSKRILRAIIYFYFITIAGILIQLFFSSIRIELFAEAISMMGIMISIEDESKFIDPVLGVYNRRAFLADSAKYFKHGYPFTVANINLTNLRFYSHMMNVADSEALKLDIINWLDSIKFTKVVYAVNEEVFAVVIPDNRKENYEYIIDILMKKFSDGWIFGDRKIFFRSVIQVARIPEDFTNYKELLEMIDMDPPSGKTNLQLVKGDDLLYVKERIRIENEIRNGLANDSFEVYYQPIYSFDTNKMHEAEALLRLIGSDGTYIPPDKIIPIAEKNGMIGEIGKIVFRKVCEFIHNEHPENYGINYIEVNLSVYQFMEEELADSFFKIMLKNDVTSNLINLEITETAASTLTDTFEKNIMELKNMGFHFSLDDFGTGYSNLSNIIKNEYENIKMDKSLLYDAYKSERAKIILEDAIHMTRNLSMNVIQEGVETKEQLEYIEKIGGNRIQGYYFSKPVPGKEFIKYVRNFNDML